MLWGKSRKPSAVWLFFFNFLLVASLRFSLVYLCVQFVYTATTLDFLVRWISRLMALWSKGVYILSLDFFCEKNPKPWPVVFFRQLANEDRSFSITIMDPRRLKIIVVVNERAKVLDICTTLMGLPHLASDGSPLFAEPMFLFGWALCNTST